MLPRAPSVSRPLVVDLLHRLGDLLQDQRAELLPLRELGRLHRGHDAEHHERDQRDQRDLLDRALSSLPRPDRSEHPCHFHSDLLVFALRGSQPPNEQQENPSM